MTKPHCVYLDDDTIQYLQHRRKTIGVPISRTINIAIKQYMKANPLEDDETETTTKGSVKAETTEPKRRNINRRTKE